MKIYLDMDGVLADFVSGVFKLTGKVYSPKGRISDPIVETNMDVPWDKMDENFWYKLPRFDWTEDVIDICVEKVGEENVWLVTTPIKSGSAGCIIGKTRWVNRFYPVFLKQILFVKDKFAFAHPHTILIDDRPKVIKPFIEAGGKAILFPTNYNDNWEHIGDMDWFKKQLDSVA